MKLNHILVVIIIGIFPRSCVGKKVSQQPKKVTIMTIPKSVIFEVSTSEKPKSIQVNLPEVQREFRAAWVATVANINWPSRRDLSTEQQKQEVIDILDVLKNNNFNAVVFQARPSADAFYESKLEPWSVFLNGKTGRAPYPYYDPLKFWIDEAHKRGIDLHVWLNPYRAHHTSGGKVTSESMVYKMSNEVVKFKNGMIWFDPSSEVVQNHVSNIIQDIIKRYDVDGVHIDDYFYPYKEYYRGKDFPDDKNWAMYQKSGGSLSRADWRRAGVNRFVERIYEEIKKEKPHVMFGISPFGIWKSGYPSDVKGISQYDELYADAKLWLNEGWCDYFSPQLYWKINSIGQNFNSLLRWWQEENIQNRHLWVGLNTVGVSGVPDRATEIYNQTQSIRRVIPHDIGEIHYNIAGLNPKMLSTLKNGTYYREALIPKSPWIKMKTLAQPSLDYSINSSFVNISWKTSQTDEVRKWILYTNYGGTWDYEILNGNEVQKQLPKCKNNKELKIISIKSTDRLGNESEYFAKEIRYQ